MRHDRGRWRAAGAGVVCLLAVSACDRSLPAAVDDGPDAVRALLEGSADSNEVDARGRTAMHAAAERGDAEVIRLLAEHGGKVDARDGEGMTPLALAARAGRLEAAFALIQAHADPDLAVGPRESRALHLAVLATGPDTPAVVRLLLRAGANPGAADAWGETPLHVAAKTGELSAVESTKLLLEAGADLTARDVRGDTPLHVAAAHDDARLLGHLASVARDLSPANAWGGTPLDTAIEKRRDRAADLLIRMGARTSDGKEAEPPLHRAARLDDVDGARSLLAFGADRASLFGGKTPLDVAHASSSARVLALLVDPHP